MHSKAIVSGVYTLEAVIDRASVSCPVMWPTTGIGFVVGHVT